MIINNEDERSESEANKSSWQAVSTLDWFLFENKIRGIIQEFVSPLFIKENYTSEAIDQINITIHSIKEKLDELDSNSSDFYSQLRRADLLYLRVDEIERKMIKQYEEMKFDLSAIKENYNIHTTKIAKTEQDIKIWDDKITRVIGNVNHTRETFLDLKSQVYKEISAMKESFYFENQKLSEEQRLCKQDQKTWMSQLENHKVLLNDLDSILEKINLDMTHKFNLTIKGLQEEKVDKWDFNSKFTFIEKQVERFREDTKAIKDSEDRTRKDLYKLIHANTQIELFEMMNSVFKEESDEKENMRNYLKQKFTTVTKTK